MTGLASFGIVVSSRPPRLFATAFRDPAFQPFESFRYGITDIHVGTVSMQNLAGDDVADSRDRGLRENCLGEARVVLSRVPSTDVHQQLPLLPIVHVSCLLIVLVTTKPVSNYLSVSMPNATFLVQLLATHPHQHGRFPRLTRKSRKHLSHLPRCPDCTELSAPGVLAAKRRTWPEPLMNPTPLRA